MINTVVFLLLLEEKMIDMVVFLLLLQEKMIEEFVLGCLVKIIQAIVNTCMAQLMELGAWNIQGLPLLSASP